MVEVNSAGGTSATQEKRELVSTAERVEHPGNPKEDNSMSNLKVAAEPGKQDIVMTRLFDAPRDLVFKVYTDPTLIPQWWGQRNNTTTVDKMEVRPGGIWRYVETDPEGNEYAFHGVYHEIVTPSRIVNTFEFEGMPGHVLLATVTFDESEGKTRLTERSVFQSVEDRDGMVQSGMEAGAAETMNRLEELLATLQA